MAEPVGAHAAGGTWPSVAELVAANVALVGHLVREALAKVPIRVSREDLTSAGMVALIVSARTFAANPDARNPDARNPHASFSRSAAVRIRRALADELRGMDWAARSAFGPAGELESVRAHLTATLGHLPSPYDLAAVMGMTVDELGALQSDLDRDPARSIDRLFAGPARDPDQHVPEREQLGYLGAAIADLPHQLRDIITLYFFGQRRLGEIATELGVSDSRLQQMRAEALRLLRDGINGRLNPAVSARVVDSARESATQSAYSTSDRAARVPQKNIPAVLKSGADGPMGGLPAHGRDGRAIRLTTAGSQIMEEHR